MFKHLLSLTILTLSLLVIPIYIRHIVVVTYDIIRFYDFGEYIMSASVIKQGLGAHLYDLSMQQAFFSKLFSNPYAPPFHYLPIYGLLFYPLTLIDFLIAYKVFFILNILFLAVITFLLGRIYPKLANIKLWWLLPFSYISVSRTLVLGQISILLLLICVLVLYFALKQNYFLAGFLAAFITIKLQYIFLIPLIFLILEKKLDFIKGFAFSAALIGVWSYLIAGPALIFDYYRFIDTVNTTYGAKFNLYNYSNYLLLANVFEITNLKLILSINIFCLLLFSLLLLKLKKKYKFEALFSISIIMVLIFSARTMDTDIVLLLIPLFSLLNRYLNDFNYRHSFLIFCFVTFISWLVYLYSSTGLTLFMTFAPLSMFILLLVILRSSNVYSN